MKNTIPPAPKKGSHLDQDEVLYRARTIANNQERLFREKHSEHQEHEIIDTIYSVWSSAYFYFKNNPYAEYSEE